MEKLSLSYLVVGGVQIGQMQIDQEPCIIVDPYDILLPSLTLLITSDYYSKQFLSQFSIRQGRLFQGACLGKISTLNRH